MTVNANNFESFVSSSAGMHRDGLANFGKTYKRHSHTALIEVFFKLIDHLAITSAIEVGAFKADFSRRFKNADPGRSALALEANPYNFEAFRSDIEAAGVQFHHAAVLDRDGPCTLHLHATEQDVKNGFIRGNNSLKLADSRRETQPLTVPGFTLDHLIDAAVAHGHLPDTRTASPVLWIDVEGALDLVIAGGKKTIQGCTALFTEVEPVALWNNQATFAEIDARLRELGLLALLRDCEYEPDQFNVIFVTQELFNNPIVHDIKFQYQRDLDDFTVAAASRK